MSRNKPLLMIKSLLSTRLLLFISALVLLSIACNVPLLASQPKSPGFVETSVAETLVSIDGSAGQTIEGQTDQTEAAPVVTDTPEITDTATLTPTVTNTPTPQVAMIYVSGNTNCRVGQGTEFDWLVTLSQGSQAEAVAVENTQEYPYWYIRRPDQTGSFCWLWGKYATPSGPYESLPVFTPMPTPTPGFDFQVTYEKLIGPCGANYYTQYKIVNNGAFTLESWRTMSDDHDGGTTPYEAKFDAFIQIAGCGFVDHQVDLTPGEAHHLVAAFTGNPAGHDITVRVKICQEDALNGDCLVKTISHTP